MGSGGRAVPGAVSVRLLRLPGEQGKRPSGVAVTMHSGGVG
jgi:hypothetical protein